MSRVKYSPESTKGFVCRGETDDGAVVWVAQAEQGQPIDVGGDEQLVSQQRLVNGLIAYGEAEYTCRRTRNEARRAEFQKLADKYRGEVEDILGFIGDVSESGVHEWCSGCLQLTTHNRVDRMTMKPTAYVCGACGEVTSECAAPKCEHMADRSTKRIDRPRFCSEHLHQIPAFARTDQQLDEIDDWRDWMNYDAKNAAKFTKIAAGVAAGVAILTPAAFASAPAIGAMIGAQAGLYGAAGTSYGLAFLGGGSLAAGGFGMAGGTAVVSAVGSGLGGSLGTRVVSAYVGSDDSFDVERLRTGTGPTVVFSSGLFTESDTGWGRWEPLIDARYPDATVLRLRWGSGELRGLASTVTSLLGQKKDGTRARAKDAAVDLSRKVSKAAVSRLKLGPLSNVMLATDVLANPWSVAKTRADMTGATLADLLARTGHDDYVLIGHSLGARVMLRAAQALGTRVATVGPKVSALHLLGAAVGQKLSESRPIELAVQDGVWNYWSENDQVLKKAYRGAQVGQKAAGAFGLESSSSKVHNVNVSNSVPSHSAYVENIALR